MSKDKEHNEQKDAHLADARHAKGEPSSLNYMLMMFAMIFFAVAIMVLGYIFIVKEVGLTIGGKDQAANLAQSLKTDFAEVEMFYPSPEGLKPVRMNIFKGENLKKHAIGVIRAYIGGPSAPPVDPAQSDPDIIDVYLGSNKVVYINFSDLFRVRFEGTAYDEYMYLKGLKTSVLANMDGMEDVRLLVEGVEADSLAGHILLEDVIVEAPAPSGQGEQ